MAFMKFARAELQKPGITFAEWDHLRTGAVSPAPDFQKRTAKVILQEYDPSRYMLSHATIVASVDVDNAPHPMGSHFVDGFEVNRKWSDYYITPETSQFINNNNDSFERKLLLAAFKTFVGAQSYVEHVQIPALSKGRIIDAAARDIGGSVYIDILIANDLKHAPLIRAIKSGKLGTLSMGCFTPWAQVSMADGTRVAIEDVAVGDLVLTHKGNVGEVTNKQIHIGDFNMKKVEVSGVASPIIATQNHPFFVLRNPEFCACGCGEKLSPDTVVDINRRVSRRFRRGHQLRVYNPNGSYTEEERAKRKATLQEIMDAPSELVEVRADQLKVGDLVSFPRRQTQNLSKGTDATLGKARLLGYFLAEGTFLKHKGVPTEVQFNFSMDEKDTFVAEVIRLLTEEFSASPWVQDRPERNTCVVHVTGRDLVTWFYENGGEYSHLKRLSQSVMNWPTECHLELVGAWINGDGTLGKDGRTSGTTTSYSLACQLHQLLADCGVFSTFYCSYGGTTCEVHQAVNSGVSLRHEDTGRLASFTLGINHSRALKEASSKIRRSFTSEPKWRSTDSHIFFTVRNITDFSYEGPVYDMEVEGDHSYVVEGVAVHNCSTSSTTCSKCGNVAEDETHLCACIRYFKGSEFKDENGIYRKVAELCGHHTDPTSVRFIEASWVANPAFKGAVLRNILTADNLSGLESKIHKAFSMPAQAANPTHMQRAARQKWAEEDFSDDFGEPEESENEKVEEDPLSKAVGDLTNVLRDQAVKQVRDEINRNEIKEVRESDPNKENESLIKSAAKDPSWQKIAKFVISFVGRPQSKRMILGLLLHKQGGWKKLGEAGFTGKEILGVSRLIDVMTKKSSIAGENRVYRTVLNVGGLKPYENVESYLAACRQDLGRVVTGSEAAMLVQKGKLFALGRS